MRQGQTDSEPLWLYLHFPLLALESLQQEKGCAGLLDTRGQALALCSYEAGQAGVEAGMAIATACSICPELELYRADDSRLQQQLESLALWAGRFSAQVALCPPQGLLLEMASMLQYFRGLKELWQEMHAQLRQQGFQVRYATGHTPLAARLLAQAGRSLCIEGREAHQQILHMLPLAQLELPARQKEQMRGMGLLRLEQLLALPREALSSRFGPALLTYLDRISGDQPDPQQFFEPPPLFQQFHEFSREVESSMALLFPLRRMIGALSGYLRQRELLAQRIELSLLERDGSHQTLTIGHAAGSAEGERWLELCRLKLEQVVLQKPVLAIQLEAEQFKALDAYSYDLFERRKQAESPLDLLSRLQIRLGDKAVQPLQLCADHRPEFSWQALKPGKAVARPEAMRPGWLLQRPQPLGAQLPAGLEVLSGPERISSGWWDERNVRRDYYVARWADGRTGWLYLEAGGGWFVHGWFG